LKRIPVIHGRAEIARLNDVGCVKSTNCHPERSRGATIQPDLRRLLLPTAVGIAKTIPRRRSVRWGSRSITFYLFLFTYKPTPARVFSSPTPDEKNRDGKNARPESPYNSPPLNPLPKNGRGNEKADPMIWNPPLDEQNSYGARTAQPISTSTLF